MKRHTIIDMIGFAGYHNDRKAYTRLFIENRINNITASNAYRYGELAREKGLKCECYECKGKFK